MNYDESLMHDRELYENRDSDAQKLWLLVYKESQVIRTFDSPEAVIVEAKTEDIYPWIKYEIGWMWDTDYDPCSFEATYRLINFVL